MNRLHRASPRRRKPHTEPLLVLEQKLAAADIVADRHPHGGPQPYVVVRQERHATRDPGRIGVRENDV